MSIISEKVIDLIINTLIEVSKNEITDNTTTRLKVEKILNSDKKYIHYQFKKISDDKNMYNLIEDFLILSAFPNKSFYSPEILTTTQEDMAWDEFRNYIKTSIGDTYVNTKFKSLIILCINMHNKNINDKILDKKSVFEMIFFSKKFEEINKQFNEMFNYLNTYTRAQEDDIELDFFIDQLTSIINSYRFDIGQLRKQQNIIILFTIIIILAMSIVIPFSFKYMDNFSVLLIIVIFFVAIATTSIFWATMISSKLSRIENEMEKARSHLLNSHMAIYDEIIIAKFSHSKDYSN